MCCILYPAGIKALFKNFPHFKQGEIRIAAYGATTADATHSETTY